MNEEWYCTIFPYHRMESPEMLGLVRTYRSSKKSRKRFSKRLTSKWSVSLRRFDQTVRYSISNIEG